MQMDEFLRRIAVLVLVIMQNEWWMTTGMSVFPQRPPLIEGDIILDETVYKITNKRNGISSRTKRDTIADHVKLWPKGVVPYVIDPDIDLAIRKRIRRAFRHISKRSCVKFIPKMPKHRDYVRFINGNGCYSSVGRKQGAQIISLDSRDCTFGTTHEVMHALGFFHEQSRPDRDRHVKILWWNIQDGKQRNFGSYANGVTDTLNQPYDINSIMHYASNSFSRNGRNTIIYIKKPWISVGGQYRKLTKIDTNQLNILYKCDVRGRRQLGHAYCRNFLTGCSYYAVAGDACESNYPFMNHYCAKSCGFCW